MELLIAVGIILVIPTMVMPNFTAARIRTNEVSALRTISAIHAAQAQYQSQHNRYAVTLLELAKVMSKKFAHDGCKFILQATNEDYQFADFP